MKIKSKTADVYILIVSITIQALSAIFGGISLMNDPSGKSIRLPATLLEGTIFPNFIIPGIILFLFLGFFPLFLIFPLIFKPNWPILNRFNIYKSYHWAWTYSVYTAIMLIIWIDVQMIILRTGSIIQGVFGLFGIFILIVALLPNVKRFYRLQERTRNHTQTQK
jgi:hypothetical protein